MKNVFGIYQFFLRPIFGNACCYSPTCSQYSQEAFRRFGFFKGLYLTVFRILRCHPLASGGYDPVPTSIQEKRNDG